MPKGNNYSKKSCDNTSTKVEVVFFSMGSASAEQKTFEVLHPDQIQVF